MISRVELRVGRSGPWTDDEMLMGKRREHCLAPR